MNTKYCVNTIGNCFIHASINRLYRYACKDEFFETITQQMIRIKNPLIWKLKYPDEVYLADWISDSANLQQIMNIIFEHHNKLLSLLSYENIPDKNIQKHWLVRRVIHSINFVSMIYDNKYAICYTQNNNENNMWENYGTDEYCICYEILASYFNNFSTPNTFSPQQLFSSSYCDVWPMHYCDPYDCVVDFIKDSNNTENINHAFYLKNKCLYMEDEVRMTYHPTVSRYLQNYHYEKINKLEDELLSQVNETDMKICLEEFLTNYMNSYFEYKESLKGKIGDENFEDSLFLKLPAPINEYVLSVKTAPNAPKDYIEFIKNLCNKHSISFRKN